MCNIKRGDLPVSITWSLMGKVVSSDPDMTTSMIGSQISLLNIKHVDYRHSGVFTCRATNSAGSVTHSAQLKVNGTVRRGSGNILIAEKPDIVPFSFGREVVNQGEFAQLICVVSRGDEPLSITWSLKGEIVSSDPVLSTSMLGQRTSLLSISRVDYQHSGVYTCRAENSAGFSSHSARLLVNGSPGLALAIFRYRVLSTFY